MLYCPVRTGLAELESLNKPLIRMNVLETFFQKFKGQSKFKSFTLQKTS